MRIVCPSCSASYDVPDSLITPGRVVRCARCSGEWLPVAAPTPEPMPRPAEPGPIRTADAPLVDAWPIRGSAMDRLAAHPAWPRSSLGLRLAWFASVVLLILAAVGAFTWRTEIMAAWPPSTRAYAAFGLHPKQGSSAHD